MTSRSLRAVSALPSGAVLYIRQSITRRKKDADGNETGELDTVSPELQEIAGRDHCARRGYRVVAVVTDLNRTGRTLKRRSVQDAIGYIERGEAQVLVVWKWSRLARNRRDFAVTCDYIESKVGGRIESSTEPIDVTTASGRLARGMLAEFAAFQSDSIGEGFKEVHARRLRRGLPATGKPRFGYRYEGSQFLIDPVTGPILTEMYHRFLGGAGCCTIAQWANDHGYVTTGGRVWRPDTVLDVLDSGFGAGVIQHRGQEYPGIHEPVIETSVWDRYRAIRAERATVPSRTKGSRYLLSSLIKCGLCEKAMYANPDRSALRPELHVWYRCHYRRAGACDNGWVKLKDVESAVFTWLCDLVGDIDAVAAVVRRDEKRVVTHEARAQVLARQVGDVDQALTRLMVDNARRPMPHAVYDAAQVELLDTRQRLVDELGEAEAVTARGVRFDLDTYRGLVSEWDTVPVAARREMLRAIMVRVRVWGGRPPRIQIDPRWETPSTGDSEASRR